MHVQFNLETMTPEQLAHLEVLNPAAVAAERLRRRKFGSVDEGLDALYKAAFELENLLALAPKRKTAREIKKIGILDIIDRLKLTTTKPVMAEVVDAAS